MANKSSTHPPKAGNSVCQPVLGKPNSRLESDSGPVPNHAADGSTAGDRQAEVHLTNAELVQLQIRVIALENLVTALLANAPDQTHELAREIAANISPRPGHTPHHLTIHAAAQMVHLVERSALLRNKADS